MRAIGKYSAVQIGGDVWFKAGAQWIAKTGNPPAGFGPKALWPLGRKAREVRVTQPGVGSRAVETLTSRRRQPSGICREKQTVKSSTMKGAPSPCQSAAAETEPNRERPSQEG